MSPTVNGPKFLLSYNGHGFEHLIEKFLPILRIMGISEEQIPTMTVENPARALTLETIGTDS